MLFHSGRDRNVLVCSEEGKSFRYTEYKTLYLKECRSRSKQIGEAEEFYALKNAQTAEVINLWQFKTNVGV